MSVDVLAVMIPIVAIVMGIGLAMVETVTGYLRRRTLIELHHKERLAAIEKGVEVPPLPETKPGHEPRAHPPTRVRRRDRNPEGVVVQPAVATKREPPNEGTLQQAILGEGRCTCAAHQQADGEHAREDPDGAPPDHTEPRHPSGLVAID